jgi:hypothetical protein
MGDPLPGGLVAFDSFVGGKLNHFLTANRRSDLPIAFSVLRLHELPVMPEDCCRRVAHFEGKLCSVVEPRKMIRAEAVPQGILRPFRTQPGAFPVVVNLSL